MVLYVSRARSSICRSTEHWNWQERSAHRCHPAAHSPQTRRDVLAPRVQQLTRGSLSRVMCGDLPTMSIRRLLVRSAVSSVALGTGTIARLSVRISNDNRSGELGCSNHRLRHRQK